MKLEELTIDTIIFGVPYINEYSDGNGPIPNRIEIYTFEDLTYYNSDIIMCVSLNAIIGYSDFYIEIEPDADLDEPILIRHEKGSYWFYTTNETKALQYFQDFLDGKFPDNRKYWDEMSYEWIGPEDENYEIV